MPNRILKESICTSESIDSLTEFQEVFFYRLLVNCDDFGRFDARTKILSSRLFPLRGISLELIENAVNALVRENMITLYTVNGKEYLQVNAWSAHQQTRACKSKYPAPEEQTSDIICNQVKSEDSKCPRYSYSYSYNDTRNSYSYNDNRDSYSLSDADAHAIQAEQNAVLEAAENAGFQHSPTVAQMLVALFADHGKEKMLEAINECVTHGAVNIAYLKAVLNGTGRRKTRSKAGDFEQRDYSDVPKEMIADLDQEVAEFLAKENAQ